MEKKKVVAEAPVRIAGTTFIPVVKISLSCMGGRNGVSFYGAKEPTAVVVISRMTKKAFRITGEEIPLEELLREVPGVREIVEGSS